jgi:hypothetical protein
MGADTQRIIADHPRETTALTKIDSDLDRTVTSPSTITRRHKASIRPSSPHHTPHGDQQNNWPPGPEPSPLPHTQSWCA